LVGGSKIKAVEFSGATLLAFSSLPDSLRFFTETILMFRNFNNRKTIFTKIVSFFLTTQTKPREKNR